MSVNSQAVMRQALYDLADGMRTPANRKFAAVFHTEPIGIDQLRGRVVAWIDFLTDMPAEVWAGGPTQHSIRSDWFWQIVIAIWANDPARLDYIAAMEDDYGRGMKAQLDKHLHAGLFASSGVHVLKIRRQRTTASWAYDRSQKLYRRLAYPITIPERETITTTT
jgi:hypothetical protein